LVALKDFLDAPMTDIEPQPSHADHPQMDNVAAQLDLHEALACVEAGIGHSFEQVSAWMDAWLAGDKPPLPAPDVTPW
jgi:hypothetical protein